MNSKKTNYPLTPMEIGMYLEQKLHPETVAYNLNRAILIKGANVNVIRTAIYDLFLSHESLHSYYGEIDGVPCRIISEKIPEIVDGENLDKESFEKILNEPGKPFVLENEIPIRLTLYPLNDGSFGLHIQIHHIAFDGSSIDILAKELFARLNGEQIKNDTLDLYEVYVKTENVNEEKNTASLEFFDKMFEGGVPENELPIKGLRPKEHPVADIVLNNILNENETLDLGEKAKNYGTTVFELMTAVYAITLGQYCASEDVVVSIPVNTRDDFSKDVIGMFVNTVPVRIYPKHSKTLSEYFSETSKTLKNAIHLYNLPFDVLFNRYCKNHDSSRNPLFDMGINYQYDPEIRSNEKISIECLASLQQMKRDIGLVINRNKTSMKLRIQFSSELFDKDIIENFFEQYIENLHRIIDGNVTYVYDLMKLPERQIMQLEKFSSSAVAEIPEALLHKVFEKTVDENKNNIALIACDKTLNYAEMNEEANKIAWNLIANGVKKGDSVVLLLPRRSYYFVALFGVLKAGAAFIPCDPEYPVERITHIINDSNASFIITTIEHTKDYNKDKVLEIETLMCGNKTENPDVAMTGDDLAYMIYTSGSTGKPKGVMLSHKGICNFCMVHPANILYETVKTQVNRMIAVTTVSFDLSLKDSVGIICNGKTVVFASEEQMNDPQELVSLINKYNVDAINATPSRYQQYIEYAPFKEALKKCKLVMAGGENYPKALLQILKQIGIEYIINTYGPTETTISSNMAYLMDVENISIGHPILNVKEYIVDIDGNLVPRGVTGELLIGGPGVAVGYHNLEEMTNKRFVEYNGIRVYKTGDYARWDKDGNVQILGRMDNQIKLRGLRIELGEIEGLMEIQPGINKAVVAVRKIGEQEQLCAWYTSEKEIDVEVLKNALKQKLTAYMVPVAFTRIDKMPVNANGKIDIKALPEPIITHSKNTLSQNETRENNILEKEIKALIVEVIGIEDFDITDKLSSIGLTSLSAIRLEILIYKKYGVSIKGIELVTDGTVLMIENTILKKMLMEKDSPEIKVSKEKSKKTTCSLSFTQQGVYADCFASPDETLYNIPRDIELPKNISVDELKNAIYEVVKAHPSFSIQFTTNDEGETIQYFASDYEPDIIIKEMSNEEFLEYRKSFIRPFKLSGEPLARFEIIKTDSIHLLMDVHHLITDGASNDIFIRQLCDSLENRKPENEDYTYIDYATDEKITSVTEKFFEDRMAECEEATELIPDVFDKNKKHSEGVVSVNTNLKKVTDFAAKNDVTSASIYLAAICIASARYVCVDDIAIATISNGRSNMNILNTIGMFVNTLPFTMNVSNNEDNISFIKRVAKNYADTILNENYPFAQIAKKYNYHPAITYAYQVGVINKYAVRGTEIIVKDFSLEKAKFPCTVFIMGSVETGGSIQINYDEAMYSEDMMLRYAKSIENVVKELIEKNTIADISLTNEEDWKVLDSFNLSKYPEYNPETTVISLFREAAKKYSDTVALVFKEKKYTYKELDEITDIIASHIDKIIEKNNKQGVVSILIPRNEYMAILPLAVQKAGCCYQPLDPSYPKERLNFMVKDADASLVIADSSLKDVLTDYSGKIILTTEIEKMIKEGIKLPLPTPAKSDDIFILLYTSGSTGTPKGVILEQRNLVTYCLWYREHYGYKVGDNLACYASFGFDANMIETYGSFTSGFTCHIIPEEIRLDLIALNKYFKENNIVGTFLTTAVGIQFATNIDDTSLKILVAGGEKMVSLEPPKNYQLVNIYGPTETTINATTKFVNEKEENIPLGKPISTTHCYIVDKYMNRLPVGAAGELIIAGPQVGRGYLNLPEKTYESFIKNPFTKGESDYHSRAYRTGDIVRWRANGEIEFVGRKDGQVKIHGFRIELKEIEAVIREYDGIKDVTVQVIDGDNGEKYIVAYIVSDGKVKDTELKKFITDKKPPYMVPTVVIELEKIPLNVNQKVDKKALPIPELNANSSNNVGTILDIEMNFLEKEIASIISEVLGVKNIGLTDEFSYMGLTSISAIKLATFIYKKYGIEVKFAELLEKGTIRMLEEAVLKSWEEKIANINNNNIEIKTEIMRPKTCSLSFTQQGVYADCLASPDVTLYNTSFDIVFPKNINAEELKNAISEVVKVHPSFSIQFTNNEQNEIIQYFAEDYEPNIVIKEMANEKFLEYRNNFVRPFKLTGEPLARFEIIKTDSIHLLMDVHHLIIDGASVDIFIRQVCDCLEGKKIEKEEYTYIDYVMNEKITPETEKFFEDRMAECNEPTELISDVFGKNQKHKSESVSIKTNLKSIYDFATKNGVTPASIYLAAMYITSARYVCEDTVAIATVSSGRNNMKISNTIGMFVNTLPLTMSIDNNEDTISFIKKVAKNYADTISNENYPFAQIAKKYDFHPSLSFTYQVGVINNYSVNGMDFSIEGLSLEKAKIPCAVYVEGSVETGGNIKVTYDEDMYSENMMLGFAKSIDNAAQGLINKKKLFDISLTNEEQWKILDSYNYPFDLNYDNSDTAVSMFRKQVELNPHKIAAVYKDKEYTYSELDEITNSFAEIIYDEMSKITGQKELSEQIIPIITSRNENIFVIPISVLKTGCAYEPLDPDYPSERLNFMVKDSSARVLIAERGLESSVNEFEGKVLYIDELYEQLKERNKISTTITNIPAPKPQDLFIMLYTSGTTGKPKGVQIEHRNLVSFVHGSMQDASYTKEAKTASYASFSFDINMADTFCTLLHGGTFYVIENDMRMNLDALAKFFDEKGITRVFLTTQVGVQFMKNYPTMKSLKTLSVGGEKLPSINPDELSYQVYNGYGPTENCCGVSRFLIKHWEQNIPLGKPFKTINAFILDKTGHRLPSGAAGEYCLSGPQIARGYLNRPDKTKEAFVNCPFNEYRMYHTGDIVRYRENGDVEFVGRKDGQVKIRGFRIELKEIEVVIREFDGIDDVTVQAYDFDGGGKYLAAFIVSKNNIDVAKLKEYIKSQKPAYMVPAAIEQIKEIPLTINRKVDKKALPAPKLQKEGYIAPNTKEEEDFCQIFKEILEIEKVGIEDDFFEMGGSSISAMKVVLAAGKKGYNIVYQDVFDNYTPRMLSSLVMGSKQNVVQNNNEAQIVSNQKIFKSYYGIDTTEIGRDGYDYSKINELLRKNTLDAFLNGKKTELNDVLFAGATGFLGIHVLYDLITNSNKKIYCIVRDKDGATGEERLKEYMNYYFNNDYKDLFGKRLFVIEGDIKDKNTLKNFKPNEKITVINCAANVAHFAKGDGIERDNIDSVNNLIDWCIENDANLVHTSTCSVFGSYKDNMPSSHLKVTEHMLYVGQYIEDNQYIYSKFMGERAIYEAILNRGLKAKVIRMSNLAPRYSDGLFQKNHKTNNFMNTLAAYKTLGEITYDMMGIRGEFSPIDVVSRAVVLLATTPVECTCFMLTNPNQPFMGNVIMNLSTKDNPIKIVEAKEMEETIKLNLNDPNKSEKLRPLLAYKKNSNGQAIIGLKVIDASYTVQILYRLGFSWPITDDNYVKKFIEQLNKLKFFE